MILLFGNSQLSEVVRVNYINSSTRIIVAQNDPNPFSDSTRISFYLPEETTVGVEFFNSHIQKVHEIKKQKYSAGKHDIMFFTTGLKPGIYFYRFATKNYVDVKKMVITKK